MNIQHSNYMSWSEIFRGEQRNKELLSRNRNIKLYQMKDDEEDSYKLMKERIF